jgi:hypothetical protein
MRTINKLEEIAALDCTCNSAGTCESCKAGTYLNLVEDMAAELLEELEDE